jgi:hypothetical protein
MKHAGLEPSDGAGTGVSALEFFRAFEQQGQLHAARFADLPEGKKQQQALDAKTAKAAAAARPPAPAFTNVASSGVELFRQMCFLSPAQASELVSWAVIKLMYSCIVYFFICLFFLKKNSWGF